MATLGDFITIKHGYAFKGTEITTEDNGVVLVTPGNFAIGGGFKEEKCKFFNGEYPVEYVLSPDDLIVTMTDLSKDMDTLGYSALIPFSGRTYLHNQRIGLINIKEESVDKHYLYWFMRTHKYQRTIAGGASGTTVHHTSPTRICEIEVDFPDIETQQSIAMILGALDDKIALNQQINKNLEEQAQAIYNELFANVSFDAVLSDLGTIVGGSTPSKKHPEFYAEQGIAWITPKDLSNDSSKFIYHGENDITELGLSKCSASIMPTGTVLFSSRAPIGYIAIAANPVSTNQGFKSVIPNKNIGTAFIYCFLKNNLPMIESMASGSTFKEISASAMKTVPAFLPNEDALKRFRNFCNPAFKYQQSLELENKRLAALRDALLPRLMSGEIDVSGIEI